MPKGLTPKKRMLRRRLKPLKKASRLVGEMLRATGRPKLKKKVR